MARLWTPEQFRLAVTNSQCFADVCRNLNISIKGRNNDTVRKWIKNLNLDISHFKTARELARERSHTSIWTEELVFIKNSKASKKTVKKLFKCRSELICSECNLGITWNNKPLVLQLDHINGDSNDDRIENLRWLCPNCHSQTDTFAGKSSFKSIEYKTKIKYTCECGNKKTRTSKVCFECFSKNKRKYSILTNNRPSKEELDILIKEVDNWSELGRRFGVSDNTIRKWAKSKK